MAKAHMNSALLDNASYWVSIAFIASVSLTLIAAVVIVYISHQRSAVKDAELKKLSADSLLAESQAASLALAQEQLRQQNLELSVQVEQEKRLRLEAETRLVREASAMGGRNGKPRTLNSEQQEVLSSTLRRFANKHVSVIEIGDEEAAVLANQIILALSGAQWSTEVSRFGVLTPPQYGVICTHTPEDQAAIALVETLRSFNLIVYERNADGVDRTEIIVGLRPAD